MVVVRDHRSLSVLRGLGVPLEWALLPHRSAVVCLCKEVEWVVGAVGMRESLSQSLRGVR